MPLFIRWFGIVLVTGFSLQAMALLDHVPESYCDPQYYRCGTATLTWVQHYQQGTTFEFAESKNLLVGSCHMVSQSYDPDHEHHAFLYFHRKFDGQQKWTGSFSFFAKTNPYGSWKVADAERETAGSEFFLFQKQENEWRSDLYEVPPYQYFLRTYEGHFYLIGFWGVLDSIVCRLDQTVD